MVKHEACVHKKNREHSVNLNILFSYYAYCKKIDMLRHQTKFGMQDILHYCIKRMLLIEFTRAIEIQIIVSSSETYQYMYGLSCNTNDRSQDFRA